MKIQKNKRKFSGHQTFVLRYGWLEKGFEFIANGGHFSDADAIVELGVGKNMVDSIKYWCELTGIVVDGGGSELGRTLLDRHRGWDPFLEDIASWWLLHWKLVANPVFQTAGTAMFSNLRKPEFSKQNAAEACLRLIGSGRKPPTDSVIIRDVDCYLRSYCGTQRFAKKKPGEESFECPLQELSLIQPMSEAGMFRFAIGRKSSLPEEIIGYAICDYLGRDNKGAMTIQNALYKEFSPGQVFMLDENALIEAVQELRDNRQWGKHFDFTETAGMAQIHCDLSPSEAESLLDGYYRRGVR
jgi:hypothetical protein